MENQVSTALNPFGTQHATELASGAQVEQTRAAAEVQAAYVIAKRFPRDERKSVDRILQACTRPGLADAATYAYARGGSDIQGPSIRLAEAIAQAWGNIRCGWRETSRGIGHDGIPYSEVLAEAVDLETNTPAHRAFVVRHWRDTKKGGYKLTDERDIYELCANQAARRLRACILALIPGDVIDAALAQCDVTLKAKAEVTPDSLARMVEAFAGFGVTKKHIEARVQRNLDAITPALLMQLRKIHNSLRDGISGPGDWFDMTLEATPITTAEKRASLPPYAPEQFDKNLPAWRKAVADGKKTPEQIIAMIGTRNAISDEQRAAILGLVKSEGKPAPEQPAAPDQTDDLAAHREADRKLAEQDAGAA
jgi:hypothetical protein